MTKRFKVEYQKGPGSPVKLAGESDEVHIKFMKYIAPKTDMALIGFSTVVHDTINDFYIVKGDMGKAKVIITAQDDS